jgi:hypothetical protein
MKSIPCNKCGAAMKLYWLKQGICNACWNPNLVVTAVVKFQVTIQEGSEVFQVEIESSSPRLAWELGVKAMGYAPHKFNTTMDLEASNTRRVVYTSKGLGGMVLGGFVKPLGAKD